MTDHPEPPEPAPGDTPDHTRQPLESQWKTLGVSHHVLLEHYAACLAEIGNHLFSLTDRERIKYPHGYHTPVECLPGILNTERGIIRAIDAMERLKQARLRRAAMARKKCGKNAEQTIQTPQKSADIAGE